MQMQNVACGVFPAAELYIQLYVASYYMSGQRLDVISTLSDFISGIFNAAAAIKCAYGRQLRKGGSEVVTRGYGESD